MTRSPDRAINPVRCWVRHVRRTAAGETGTTIAGGVFIRESRDALSGAQGWQSGVVTAALSDTGELSIVFPNTVGEDGKRHLRRFASLTDGAYRPGEEWLELYREPHDVLAVCTPYKTRKSRKSIELIGYDVAGLLNRFRGSELDVWDGHAPRDVWEHYCRLPGLVVGTDFAGFLPNTGSVQNGWGGLNIKALGPAGEPRINGNDPTFLSGALQMAVSDFPAPNAQPDCWTVELRGTIRNVLDVAAGYVMVGQAGIVARAGLDGSVKIQGTAVAANRGDGPPGPDAVGKLRANPSGALSLRIIVRYDRCWLLVNGEVAVEWRRSAQATFTVGTSNLEPNGFGAGAIVIAADGCIFDVASYHLEALRPFALRGTDKGSYRLPGIPPAGGLRARYYNAAGAQANYTTYPARVSRVLSLTSEPTVERLEPAIDLLKGDTVPGMAGAYLARWTGSIYLDLAASDRQVRLGEQAGYARLFIGRTIRNVDELVARWPTHPNFASNDFTVADYLKGSSRAFEVDTANWATTGIPAPGATLTRVTADNVIHGTAVGKVVTTAAAASQGVQVIPDATQLTTFAQAVTYQAVVYLRGAVGGEIVRVGLGGSGDNVQSGAITLPGPTQDAIAVQVNWTPTLARSATTFGLYIVTTAATAMTFYVDRARIITATALVYSAPLRATLGSEAGWYPIVVEGYAPSNSGGYLLEDRNSTLGGLGGDLEWQLVGPSRLSPIGIYEEHNRDESCRAVLDAITETFGYQWRTEPRSLESGEFPGQIIPRVRIGRDTGKVLEDVGSVDVVVDGTADETIDSLIADAAGIADPTGSGQLAAQVIDYPNALAHLGIHTDYESLSEMSEATGLETRLGSLLALRSSPAEQVGIRPTDGSRDLVDTWPLTGVLSKLRWQPGDGIRLCLKDVDVVDRTPRQLTRVELGVAPNAIAPPIVGFRQRPRSPAAVLKRTMRAVYALGRNYQGTMTLLPGSPGSATGNGAAPAAIASGSPDTYSRLLLPVDRDTIDRVWLYIHVAIGAGGIIEVNAVSTAIAVAGVGLYDITPFASTPVASIPTNQNGRLFARVINAAAGATHEYMLLGRYRI